MSNIWLNACKMEAGYNYAEAVVLFLNDATESFKKSLLARAGLSCTCAADCLVKLGADELQKKVYFLAATFYMENANSARHRSTREWLWSLQKAYENFLFADKTSMAEEVRNEYLSLAKRVHPFKETKLPSLKSDPLASVVQTSMKLPEKVVSAVKTLEQNVVSKYGRTVTENKIECEV